MENSRVSMEVAGSSVACFDFWSFRGKQPLLFLDKHGRKNAKSVYQHGLHHVVREY